MKIAICSVFFLIHFSACRPGTTDHKEGFKHFITDTVVSNRSTNEIDDSIQKCIDFNLPQIHNGVDSFELRIWVSGMMTPSQLLILRFANLKWSFQKYYYYGNENEADSIKIFRQEIPGGIDKLVKYLQQDDIVALPSQVAIPGFIDKVNDGQTCTIEISTKRYYKALKYHCAEHYEDRDNRKFISIINFLNGFFNFYHPWCI